MTDKELSLAFVALINRKNKIKNLFLIILWAHRDLNPEPADYESVALTN